MPFIKDSLVRKKVLDVGCGNGMVAQTLHEEFKCDISLCDVIDLRREGINNFSFKIASAEKLPYPDKSFDIVFLQFLLHHIKSKGRIKKVLREVRRVASEKIIIYEEIATDKTNHKKAKEYDEYVNIEIHGGYKLKVVKYYSLAELKEMFTKLDLKISLHRRIEKGREKAGFVEKHLFILDI